MNLSGQAAVVTNVRDPSAATGGPSRGELIASYLAGGQAAKDYADNLASRPYACTRIRLAGQGIDAVAQFDTFHAAGGVAEPQH